MSRHLLCSFFLAACSLSAATWSLAGLPAPAPQRAEGRKAPPATRTPLPTMTPRAGLSPQPTALAASASRGGLSAGGKSAINSQPVPPGKTAPAPALVAPGNSAIHSQPVPPGKPVSPVGPGPVDPAARKVKQATESH